ncbi:MAG: transcription elongation factor GreA [Clostridiales bacterium]|nr:transcription elongation factor GreA [Clostridiales bacterium]
MDEKNFMTVEGLERTKERLNYLKSVERQNVADKIAEARSYGDLSENSEYEVAREEQSRLEAEIFELENKLKNAEIIDTTNLKTNKVSVGCKVKVLNLAMNRSFEYTIVGDTDSNPLKGLISNVSPIGAGLLGKKIGETVAIKTPAGISKFKIEKIEI